MSGIGAPNLDPDWGMACQHSKAEIAQLREDAAMIRMAVKVIKKYGEGPTMTLRMIQDLAERLDHP